MVRWCGTRPRRAGWRCEIFRRGARPRARCPGKDGSVSSDELEWIEKELEKVTHGQVAKIDEMLSHKERELLEV